MVAITRSQMRRGIVGVDVTVMSSSGKAKAFAPTWDLVLGHKGRSISDDEYAFAYGALLSMVSHDDWNWLGEQADSNSEVRLLCYCRDNKFCHTHMIGLFAEAILPDVFECKTNPPDEIKNTQWFLELAGANNNQVQS